MKLVAPAITKNLVIGAEDFDALGARRNNPYGNRASIKPLVDFFQDIRKAVGWRNDFHREIGRAGEEAFDAASGHSRPLYKRYIRAARDIGIVRENKPGLGSVNLAELVFPNKAPYTAKNFTRNIAMLGSCRSPIHHLASNQLTSVDVAHFKKFFGGDGFRLDSHGSVFHIN